MRQPDGSWLWQIPLPAGFSGTTFAATSNIDTLLAKVVDPNSELPLESRLTIAKLKDGRTVAGMVRERTPAAVKVQTYGFDPARARIEGAVVHNIQKLAQGGTAVGTGLNAPEGFDAAMAAALSRDTGIAFEPARNKFEALASHDGRSESTRLNSSH